MNDKQNVIDRALQFAESLLGTYYSRTARYRIYNGGSFDCSSFMLGIYSYAGFPLLDSIGNELLTSTYQVKAAGFELLYPAKRAEIGKNLPSPSGLNSAYGAEPGDMFFYCNNPKTTRANMITHVAMVFDKKSIIHNGNNNEKCCKKPITYGRRKVCAIIRLRETIQRPARPVIKRGHGNRAFSRMLQLSLNMHSLQPKLLVDGQIGDKSVTALNAFKKAAGLPANGICDAATWEALNPYESGSITIEGGEALFKKGDKGDSVIALQRVLKVLGYELGTFGPDKDGIDGNYGVMTQNAVKRFQETNGLTETGIVDTQEVAALFLALLRTHGNDGVLEAALADANAKIAAAKNALA